MKILIICLMLFVTRCGNDSSIKMMDGIATPNKVNTHFGTINLFDGVTKKDSVEDVYHNLDRQRATEVFLSGLPLASMSAMRRANLGAGKANETLIIYENFLDSSSLFLTPNATSVYFSAWLELSSNQAMVVETPPNILGMINNHFFEYVVDLGNLGPDKGQGGKFLIIPPDYTGEIPSGYHIVRTSTYGNWLFGRGFAVDGDPKPATDSIKKHLRVYPYKSSPKAMIFVNGSTAKLNTLHHVDERIYEEINSVIQAEPTDNFSPELLGEMYAIGIIKGKEFNPDKRMQQILKEAAAIGAVTARTLLAYPRNKKYYIFTNSTSWINPIVGNYTFTDGNARDLDAKSIFHFYATAVSPAMTMKFVGLGSQYAYSYTDSKGALFDGGKTYKVTLPANVPAKDNWSFTVYDSQTRSMLQTSQPFATVGSLSKDLVQNEDGSYDIYFGPKAPKGFEANWIETIPNKSWNTIFRLYGPLEPWFNKTWQLSDPIVVNI